MLQYVLTSIVQMLADKLCHTYINVPMFIYTELSLYNDWIQVRFTKYAKLRYFSQYSRLLSCDFCVLQILFEKMFLIQIRAFLLRIVQIASKKSTITVGGSANREPQEKINKMDTQYICIKCILYICQRCLGNFMMILQEMSYDNLVLICIFCKHLTKI